MNDYQEAEVVDTATGEVIENSLALVEQSAIANWQGIAQQPFDKKTAQTLEAKIPDDVIEIRPDGMIYLPQIEYRRILNKAFGVGAWALRRLAVQVKDQTVIFDGELWANGRYISGAMGEQDYIESNKNMSWATAVESAKSDCLTRCCKDIGIAIDLWNPRYVKKWKEEFALQVWCESQKGGQKKPLWRRKDDPPIDSWPWKEQSGNKQPEPQPKTTTTKQEQKGGSSPQFAEKARTDFVNYAKKVFSDQMPAPMDENLVNLLLRVEKTPEDMRKLLKWFVFYIEENDKVRMNKKLGEWSNGRGHTEFGMLDIEEAPDKDIEFAYGKAKKDFKAWVEGLDGKAEPPTLEDVAAGAEKAGKP